MSFTDLSTGDITSWLWDFGDGETSTSQNPTHMYTKSGTYTVSLTVTGPGGTETKTKADYISVDSSGGSGCFISSSTSHDPATHGLLFFVFVGIVLINISLLFIRGM